MELLPNRQNRFSPNFSPIRQNSDEIRCPDPRETARRPRCLPARDHLLRAQIGCARGSGRDRRRGRAVARFDGGTEHRHERPRLELGRRHERPGEAFERAAPRAEGDVPRCPALLPPAPEQPAGNSGVQPSITLRPRHRPSGGVQSTPPRAARCRHRGPRRCEGRRRSSSRRACPALRGPGPADDVASTAPLRCGGARGAMPGAGRPWNACAGPRTRAACVHRNRRPRADARTHEW